MNLGPSQLNEQVIFVVTRIQSAKLILILSWYSHSGKYWHIGGFEEQRSQAF